MARVERDGGVVRAKRLPSGQYAASWTGPDGTEFGLYAPTKAQAMGLLDANLSQRQARGVGLAGPKDETDVLLDAVLDAVLPWLSALRAEGPLWDFVNWSEPAETQGSRDFFVYSSDKFAAILGDELRVVLSMSLPRILAADGGTGVARTDDLDVSLPPAALAARLGRVPSAEAYWEIKERLLNIQAVNILEDTKEWTRTYRILDSVDSRYDSNDKDDTFFGVKWADRLASAIAQVVATSAVPPPSVL